MFTRKYYTLGYVLVAIGILLFFSFIPIGYLGIFGVLSADPWANAVVLNLLVGPLLGWTGAVLAGEL